MLNITKNEGPRYHGKDQLHTNQVAHKTTLTPEIPCIFWTKICSF
jgi:hypothetical protein